MNIFIVDDELDLLALYTDALECFGHKVVGSARNGAEAVEKYAGFAERPDLVLMDHRMPIKNGLEATREIMQLDPGARVIFASADQSVEAEALELGAVGFKSKPFSLAQLQSNLDALDRKH